MASRKHRHRDILKAFAEQVQHCEAEACWPCTDWSDWPCKRPLRLEIHHVMGGAHRIDAPWNLVRLCSSAHQWVTANPIEGRSPAGGVRLQGDSRGNGDSSCGVDRSETGGNPAAVGGQSCGCFTGGE